jgi:hypothetical protein
MTEDLPDLAAGIYRHYKGPLYQVFGYAHDANADVLHHEDSFVQAGYATEPLGERFVVVYMALQLDGAHTGPRTAVRTASDFLADVCGEPTCPDYGKVVTDVACERCDAMSVPRFAYVGTVWEGDGG